MISSSQAKIIKDAINVLLVYAACVIDYSDLRDQKLWLLLMLSVYLIVILRVGVKELVISATILTAVNLFLEYIYLLS